MQKSIFLDSGENVENLSIFKAKHRVLLAFTYSKKVATQQILLVYGNDQFVLHRQNVCNLSGGCAFTEL